MKWFNRDQNVKKKDEKSTYLTFENGKVVPVSDSDKKPSHDNAPEGKPPNPDEVASSPVSKPMRWVWLIFIVLLAYGTIHLYGVATKETKVELNLQEIQRNMVEKTAPSPSPKSGEIPSENPGKTIADKTGDWKEELKGAFKTTPKQTEESKAKKENDDILFAVRDVDESGTALLQQIREDSLKYIQGDLSRGQYILRVQSTDLKMNRYDRDIQAVSAKIPVGHRYEDYMKYVHLKEEGLQSLLVELRVAPQERVSVIFNNAVDFHNELSEEADSLFIKELKDMGYQVEKTDGKIRYTTTQ